MQMRKPFNLTPFDGRPTLGDKRLNPYNNTIIWSESSNASNVCIYYILRSLQKCGWQGMQSSARRRLPATVEEWNDKQEMSAEQNNKGEAGNVKKSDMEMEL